MANGRATPFTQGPGPGPEGISPEQGAFIGRAREQAMGEPVDIEMAIMDPSTPIDRILALVTNRIISEPTPQTAQAVSQFAETLGSVINQTVEGAAPPAAPVGPGGPVPPGAGPAGPPAPGGPPGLPPM